MLNHSHVLQSFLTFTSGFSLQWIRRVLELGKDKVMGFTGELVPLLLGFETSGPRGKTGPVKSQARLIAVQLRDLIRSAGRDAAGAVVDYSQVRLNASCECRSPSNGQLDSVSDSDSDSYVC
jgi:hypothetical protein